MMSEPSKCAWASCQKLAMLGGKLCEAHAKQASQKAEPILANAEAPISDLGSKGEVPRPLHLERAVQMPETDPSCEGCGKHHGSVRAEIECMRNALRLLTKHVQDLAAKIKAGR